MYSEDHDDDWENAHLAAIRAVHGSKLPDALPETVSMSEAVKLFDSTAMLKVGALSRLYVRGEYRDGTDNAPRQWSTDSFVEPSEAWDDAAKILGGSL